MLSRKYWGATKKSGERYQNLFKEKKKAWERSERYGFERYKNLSEDEKQKLLEYTKNIEWEKTLYYKYKEVF